MVSYDHLPPGAGGILSWEIQEEVVSVMVPHQALDNAAEPPRTSLPSELHAVDGDLTTEQELKRRLARELHDQVAQTLTTMLIDMENFKGEQAGRQSVLRRVGVFQESTRKILSNIRQLLYDLRNEPGIEIGFVDAIRTGILRNFEQRTGISVKLSVSKSWPKRLASQASLNLYRIIQEALNNARLHGGARSVHVALRLRTNGSLMLTVQDDGRGIQWLDETRHHGMGLMGMRERAVLLGGNLEIENGVDGGTTVRVIFPKE
jgi:two-component system sensor histidine kinase UhpB